MPNHVINELIFRGVTAEMRQRILSNVLNSEGHIDFEILVPSPLNVWPGNVGERHKNTLRATHLDWATREWGTKWNAYGIDEGGRYKSVAYTDDTLTLTFQTAWRPPYGWIVAIFNAFKIGFEHRWLDEGRADAVVGVFDYDALGVFSREPWDESTADEAIRAHLHTLMYGVPSFDEEVAEDR